MRTIKHIFISAALLTGFASCDLNEFPKDSISPDTFFIQSQSWNFIPTSFTSWNPPQSICMTNRLT